MKDVYRFPYRSAWYAFVEGHGELPVCWLNDYDGKRLEFVWPHKPGSRSG